MNIFPKQHGAWAILFTSFIVGMASGGFAAQSLFVLAGALAAFIVYNLVITSLRRSSFAMAFAWHRRWERSLAGEILEAMALCAVAPLAAYAGSGRFGMREISAGMLCGIFFCARIIRVRYLVRLRETPIRILGYREIAYAAVFAAFAVFIFNNT
ncbi:MAG: YwiC-like family protein, partial [Deltaproteobacteria bacterium]|nr:YwiC-like family protein [Deltaproteobacteria bacterium]